MRGVMRIPCSAPAYVFPRQRVPDGRKSRAAFHVHTGFWKTGVRTGGFLAAFAPYRNCVGGAKRAYLAAAHQNADMKTPMPAKCRYRPHSRISSASFPPRGGLGLVNAAPRAPPSNPRRPYKYSKAGRQIRRFPRANSYGLRGRPSRQAKPASLFVYSLCRRSKRASTPGAPSFSPPAPRF